MHKKIATICVHSHACKCSYTKPYTASMPKFAT